LENLQVNFETANSRALKLTENANIENASTPTRAFKNLTGRRSLSLITKQP